MRSRFSDWPAVRECPHGQGANCFPRQAGYTTAPIVATSVRAHSTGSEESIYKLLEDVNVTNNPRAARADFRGHTTESDGSAAAVRNLENEQVIISIHMSEFQTLSYHTSLSGQDHVSDSHTSQSFNRHLRRQSQRFPTTQRGR